MSIKEETNAAKLENLCLFGALSHWVGSARGEDGHPANIEEMKGELGGVMEGGIRPDRKPQGLPISRGEWYEEIQKIIKIGDNENHGF